MTDFTVLGDAEIMETDITLLRLAKETQLLLENIGGASNLNVELSYYDPNSLRQQFCITEDLTVRLFDSWWNTTRRQLLIRNKFHKLRQAIYEEGIQRLSSMSIDAFRSWLTNVFGANLAELSGKRNWKQFVDEDGAWACLQFIGRFPKTTHFYDWIVAKVGIECWENARDKWEKYAGLSWQTAEEIAYRMQVPQTARKGIHGMGTVLICDFLKEVGIDYYGKTDTQVKRVFERLSLIDKHQQEWKTFKLFWRIAALTGHPPTVVDKSFWIAASGRWDKTLDKALDEDDRRKQQMHRRQHFSSFLDKFRHTA